MAALDRGKAKAGRRCESEGCVTWKKVRGTDLLKFETQQGNLVSVRPSPQIFVPPREVCGVELGETVAAPGVGALGAVVPAAAGRRWVAQLKRSQFLRLQPKSSLASLFAGGKTLCL